MAAVTHFNSYTFLKLCHVSSPPQAENNLTDVCSSTEADFFKRNPGTPGGENFFKGILGKIPPEGEEIPLVGGEKHWVRMKFDVFLSKTDCLKIMFYLSK